MDPQVQELIRAVNRLRRMVLVLWLSFVLVLVVTVGGVIWAVSSMKSAVDERLDTFQSASDKVQNLGIPSRFR